MTPPLLRPIRRPALLLLALGLTSGFAADARAIEMFTFFGDGSRIGLPSLEVPVEAYPGIPLRSDRLRARRRAARLGPAATLPVGPANAPRGVTIRAMPPAAPLPPAPPPTSSP